MIVRNFFFRMHRWVRDEYVLIQLDYIMLVVFTQHLLEATYRNESLRYDSIRFLTKSISNFTI